jgi:hypothetical protein
MERNHDRFDTLLHGREPIDVVVKTPYVFGMRHIERALENERKIFHYARGAAS